MYGYGDDVDPLPETVDLVEVRGCSAGSALAAGEGVGGRAGGGAEGACFPLRSARRFECLDPPHTSPPFQDIVLDYTTKLLRAALDGAAGRAKARGGNKATAVTLGPEDIMYLVRHDARKFARVRELLVLQEEIKKAKSIVDTSPEEIARLA